MTTQTKENVLIVVMIVFVLAAIVYMEVAWWKECLRVHPTWYCYGER